jgi:Cu/Ag efflux protein CusF
MFIYIDNVFVGAKVIKKIYLQTKKINIQGKKFADAGRQRHTMNDVLRSQSRRVDS